jgi:hypothetical protein
MSCLNILRDRLALSGKQFARRQGGIRRISSCICKDDQFASGASALRTLRGITVSNTSPMCFSIHRHLHGERIAWVGHGAYRASISIAGFGMTYAYATCRPNPQPSTRGAHCIGMMTAWAAVRPLTVSRI